MAIISISRAAELTGRNRITLYRAMKSGKLSYTVGPHKQKLIDTAELLRVFPDVTLHDVTTETMNPREISQNPINSTCSDVTPESFTLLQSAFSVLQEQLKDAAERERRLEARIQALERRNDALEQLCLPLGKDAPETNAPRKSWWRRLFGQALRAGRKWLSVRREKEMKKRKHWANVFAMFGVAMLATAFFQEGNATWGYVWGVVSVWISGKLAKEDE